MHMQSPEEDGGCPALIFIYSIPFRYGLVLSLDLGYWPAHPSDLVSALHTLASTGDTGICGYTQLVMLLLGSELRSSLCAASFLTLQPFKYLYSKRESI